MRLRIVLTGAAALAACQDAAPTGPVAAAPSVVEVAQVTPAPAPAPRIIACGGTLPPSGPLYVVDGGIVSDSVGRLAASAPTSRVEVVPAAEATTLYGSRARAGVVVVSTAGPSLGSLPRAP